MSDPHQLIKEIREDSEKYSAACIEMGQCERFRAIEVTELYASGDFKSQQAAERKWETTPNGQKYLELKWVIKGIEKVLSAKKTELRGLQEESHNQY